MAPPPLQVSSVTIGSPNPRELASFYQRLLGWTVSALEDPRPGEPPESGWAQLRYPSEGPGLMTLNIEFELEYVRPVWPSAPGQQHITAHLDIPVDDLETAVGHALDAGATLAEVQPQERVRVLLDPAGHPFCLFLTD
jgi:catechol 2,3-dioxygenase-like lactoylglutathione lyase family enzyme